MAEITWKRNRISSPRTRTWHVGTSKFGVYNIERIGNNGYRTVYFSNDGTDKFIGSYTTLKEGKKEAGYHNGRLNFNAVIARSSPKLWR